MLEFQKRVVDELEELTSKIQRLEYFLDNDKFKDITPAEQELLQQQYRVMIEYQDILQRRIRTFNA